MITHRGIDRQTQSFDWMRFVDGKNKSAYDVSQPSNEAWTTLYACLCVPSTSHPIVLHLIRRTKNTNFSWLRRRHGLFNYSLFVCYWFACPAVSRHHIGNVLRHSLLCSISSSLLFLFGNSLLEFLLKPSIRFTPFSHHFVANETPNRTLSVLVFFVFVFIFVVFPFFWIENIRMDLSSLRSMLSSWIVWTIYTAKPIMSWMRCICVAQPFRMRSRQVWNCFVIARRQWAVVNAVVVVGGNVCIDFCAVSLLFNFSVPIIILLNRHR